jgi:hypothetical protein
VYKNYLAHDPRRKKMKKKILSIVVILSAVALAASLGFAGGPAPEKGSAQAAKGEPIVVKGKVDFVQAVDRYFVRAEHPHTDLMVVNPNPKFLGQLSKSGKIVTIQGRMEGGADLLFIEKVDGKPYRGE